MGNWSERQTSDLVVTSPILTVGYTSNSMCFSHCTKSTVDMRKTFRKLLFSEDLELLDFTTQTTGNRRDPFTIFATLSLNHIVPVNKFLSCHVHVDCGRFI